MSGRTFFVGVVVVQIIFLLTITPAHAVQSLTAVVFGVNKTGSCPTPPATCEILLSGSDQPGHGLDPATYGNWTITGTDANYPAKIVAQDNVVDVLRIENAIITGPQATSPCTNLKGSGQIQNCPYIYVIGSFTPPVDNGVANVSYVREIGGTITRNGAPAVNSAISFYGRAWNYQVGSEPGYRRICATPPATCQVIDSPTYMAQGSLQINMGSGMTDREHHLQLWFSSNQANDAFRLNYAKVRNPGAGFPKPDCIVYPPNTPKSKKKHPCPELP